MKLDEIDWKALERLRSAFLAGTAGDNDYWRSESDLASYDATFAQRIGWKWDYVLAELKRRGWLPGPGTLMDWGCGSGIAHRALLDFFGTDPFSDLLLWDRSPLAMRFAERRASQKYLGLKVATSHRAPASNPSNSTLLLSHVLTELQPAEVEALADFAATAASVIWVEPGTHEASRILISVRERLRDRLNVIAPCTHQSQCGMLTVGNENHWCHHFAPPPPEIFMDGQWAKFGELAGVDLRSLPLSFLVMDRRPAPVLPAGATRVIGHPRIQKPYALLFGCNESGVSEKRLTKRAHPEKFRELKRGDSDSLQVWRCEGDEIVESAEFPSAGLT